MNRETRRALKRDAPAMAEKLANSCLDFQGAALVKVTDPKAIAALRRLRCDGWTCPECGEPVPMFRRADADYCREACRKRAARKAAGLTQAELAALTGFHRVTVWYWERKAVVSLREVAPKRFAAALGLG